MQYSNTTFTKHLYNTYVINTFMVNSEKNQELFDYEKFHPILQKSVSGTYFVTLRKEVVLANGWSEGDRLKVLAAKRNEDEKDHD